VYGLQKTCPPVGPRKGEGRGGQYAGISPEGGTELEEEGASEEREKKLELLDRGGGRTPLPQLDHFPLYHLNTSRERGKERM